METRSKEPEPATAPRFARFAEFYAFYLSCHGNRMCRRAHFLGYSSAIAALAQFIDSPGALWLGVALASMLAGSWIGHRVMDKAPQPRFTQPVFALRAGWTMYWHMLSGKLSW